MGVWCRCAGMPAQRHPPPQNGCRPRAGKRREVRERADSHGTTHRGQSTKENRKDIGGALRARPGVRVDDHGATHTHTDRSHTLRRSGRVPLGAAQLPRHTNGPTRSDRTVQAAPVGPQGGGHRIRDTGPPGHGHWGPWGSAMYLLRGALGKLDAETLGHSRVNRVPWTRGVHPA